MKKLLRASASVTALGLLAVGLSAQTPTLAQRDEEVVKRAEEQRAEAQDAARMAAEQARKESEARDASRLRLIPLSVQVVISRHQGEKRVSSLPYTLAINANALVPGNLSPGLGTSIMRMGAQIPVSTGAGFGGKPEGGSVQYRDIGTSIDGSAYTTDDGRFRLHISVEDTSVYSDDQTAGTPRVSGLPVFRSFRSQNELVLRDGQSSQFTAATDRVTGEVIRVDVTLTVVK